MALNMNSGFSRLANTEAHIRDVLASIVIEPEPKHRPYVSKKKEAKRLQAQQQLLKDEQQQQLNLLSAATLDQIVFDIPSHSAPTLAGQAQSELDDFAAQLAREWGLFQEASVVTPPPVVAQPKRMPKKKAKPVFTAPPAPAAKTKPVLSLVKRQIEVVLQVMRADGSQVPFYHCDTGISEFEAEIAAGKKARSFGLRVVSTINIIRKEYALET